MGEEEVLMKKMEKVLDIKMLIFDFTAPLKSLYIMKQKAQKEAQKKASAPCIWICKCCNLD